MQKPVYFSIADRQLESFLDPAFPPESAFEKSLALNVLFQSGILVPDIFFFISKGLESHIKKHQTRKSLFEACVEKNIVIPTFRGGPSVSSFQDALYIIQGRGKPEQAIQGVRNSAEEIARRLQLVQKEMPIFHPYIGRYIIWEKNSTKLSSDI